MSEAATQALPPSITTAQSSPIGTTTSCGLGGSRPERRRTTSNSFTGPRAGGDGAGRGTPGSAESPPSPERRQKPRKPPRRPRAARRSPHPSARRRAAAEGPPEPQPTSERRAREARSRYTARGAAPRSTPYRPDPGPQPVRVLARVPGAEAAPLLLGRPQVVVVGGPLQPDLAPDVPCDKAHPRVQLRVVGGLPRLDPRPPRQQGAPNLQARLLPCLAPGAGLEVLAGLEDTTRVLPQTLGRLPAPHEERPRLGPPRVGDHHAGPQDGVGDGVGVAGGGRGGPVRWGLAELSHGVDHTPDVLRRPPARQLQPLVDGDPPVVEVLVGDPHLL